MPWVEDKILVQESLISEDPEVIKVVRRAARTLIIMDYRKGRDQLKRNKDNL